LKSVLLAGAACLVALPSALRAQAPVGSEFQVNAYTTGGQGSAAVATDAHGNFVVVWSDAAGIVGRRFTASGAPRGGEFLVSSYTAGYPSLPAVASSANGSFVVVWHSYGPDGSASGVFGHRFDAFGAPAGGEFAVNTYTTGSQSQPAVSSDASGNFVVVWHSAGQDGNGYGVFGRRFDASGAALGGEFLVNSYTMGYIGSQFTPAVDSDASGNFVVVWVNRYSFFGPVSNRISGQRFDSAGIPQGTEFMVDMSTGGGKGGPHVARDGAGNFLVVWTISSGFPIPTGRVLGRFFDANATPLGPEFMVNSFTAASQGGASVDADLNGNFVVVWQSRGQEGPSFETGVFGQRFDASGAPVDSEFIVNSYTTGNQSRPAVVSSPDENFLVVWQSDQGGDDDVFGQRFGDRIFRDGFEP